MAVNYLGYSFSAYNAFKQYVELSQFYGLTAAIHGRSVTGTLPRVYFIKMRAGDLDPLPDLNFLNTPKEGKTF